MALLHTTFCRLSLSNVFLPYKYCCNRLSTSTPLPKLSVEEKLGIKPRPKRPRSSFLRFLSQVKPQILEQNPKATVTEINRIAGEKWRYTDEKVKSKLMEEYKTDWNKYLDDINTYNKKLSPVQKEEIQKAHEMLSQSKKKKKLKKKMEEMGKPKKPASTFVSYMQSKIHERGETPFKEWQQVIKKEWESAPASVKEKFQNNFQKGMESYKTELEMWEKKMKREGHQDLTDSKLVCVTSPNSTKTKDSEILQIDKQSTGPESVNQNETAEITSPSIILRLFKIVCLSIVTFYSLVFILLGFKSDH